MPSIRLVSFVWILPRVIWLPLSTGLTQSSFKYCPDINDARIVAGVLFVSGTYADFGNFRSYTGCYASSVAKFEDLLAPYLTSSSSPYAAVFSLPSSVSIPFAFP